MVGVVVFLAAIAAVIWFATASSRSAHSGAAPTAMLPDRTSMGVVDLNVQDIHAMQAYYVDAVGLGVLDEADGEATLGLDEPLLRLISASDGEAQSTPTEAGLYHSAILYPDEASLAAVLVGLAATAPETFQGSSDHAVSQAFYFVDPEGNGLELYVDRPRDEWVWENGEVTMGSAMLDPNAFIQEHFDGSATGSAVMGHVHLKVGDLAEAETFYADTLGFAVTARSDGALFYAAGGYHHHLATNTWQTAGAGPRANATGLAAFTVTVPDAAAIDEIARRLDAAGHAFEQSIGELVTTDPWGNVVRIVVS